MAFDIKEIVEAWASRLNPNSEFKGLAEKRLKICKTCENKKYHRKGKFYYCDMCGCPLAGKSFSHKNGACPGKKWDEVDNEYFSKNTIKSKKLV